LDFLLSSDGLLDPKIAALVAMAFTQWIKGYLPDWRYTQLVVLGCTMGLELAAMALGGRTDVFSALMAGFWGASIATFGYETIANWLGVLGLGQRTGK
jgi:hypothetical protein